MLRFLYFFIFPIILVYPNGLFAGTYLNYIYTIFVFFTFLIFDKKNKFKFTIVNKFFLLLFLIVLIGNMSSSLIRYDIELLDYLSSTLRYFIYFVISTLLISTSRNERDFKFWTKSFLFGYGLSLVVLILDSFRINWIETVFKMSSFEEMNTLDIYFRAFGSYLSPISAGVFILNSFLLIMTMLITKVVLQRKVKLILWSLSILSVMGIIMTASRTSLVALGMAVLLLGLFSKLKVKFVFVFLLITVVVYKVGFLDIYIDNIVLRNENEASYSQGVLEGSGRLETMSNSIRLFLNERTFFFGVGPSEYSVGDGKFSLAHNGFFSLLFCYGFFGVILFFRTGINLYRITYSRKIKFINNESSKFMKLYLFLFLVINAITFISSDGPVTHFWLIYLMIFLFFVENYINYGSFVLKKKTD